MLRQTVVELVGAVETAVLPGLLPLLHLTVPQQTEVDLAGVQVEVQEVVLLPVAMVLLRLPLQATELLQLLLQATELPLVEEVVEAGVEMVEVELQDHRLLTELLQTEEAARGEETEVVTAVEDLQALTERQHPQHHHLPTEHLPTEVDPVGMQVVTEEMAEDLQIHTEHLHLRHLRHLMERLPTEVAPSGTQEAEMEETEAGLPRHMELPPQQHHHHLTEHLQMEEDQVGVLVETGVVQVGVRVETVVVEGGLPVPTEHQLPPHRVMERLQTAADPVGAGVMEAEERQLHILPTELLPPPHLPTEPPLTEEVLVGVGEVVEHHPEQQRLPVHTELLRRTEVVSNTPQTADTFTSLKTSS